MSDKKTEPLPREAIENIDTLLAKYLLLVELRQIPEFVELWQDARRIADKVIEVIHPRIKEIFDGMSAECRGALLIGEKAHALYDKAAINEAQERASKLNSLCRAVDQVLQEGGIRPDYRSKLEAQVEPLGVPDLVDVMMLLDTNKWGLNQLLCGTVAGPLPDLLEMILVREITDLSPAEAALETPARLRRRTKQKLAPLGRHLRRHDLQRRIRLWVRNVVRGETIEKIADKLTKYTESLEGETYSYEWVRKQIRQATKILGAKRQFGRPRKGGVLQQWKIMTK